MTPWWRWHQPRVSLLFRFRHWLLRRHYHQWQLQVGCALDVDPHFREFEFIVARSCPRCGLVEVLE